MVDTDEVEITTFTIETAAGDSEELELPTELVDVIREEGDTAPRTVADMAVLSFAQQAHAIVHHGHGEIDEGLEAAEGVMLDIFEEHFGVSYAEATGHGH